MGHLLIASNIYVRDKSTLSDLAIVRNSREKRQMFSFALSFDTFVVSDTNVNDSVFHEEVLLRDFR
jgi:hypothetical protein